MIDNNNDSSHDIEAERFIQPPPSSNSNAAYVSTIQAVVSNIFLSVCVLLLFWAVFGALGVGALWGAKNYHDRPCDQLLSEWLLVFGYSQIGTVILLSVVAIVQIAIFHANRVSSEALSVFVMISSFLLFLIHVFFLVWIMIGFVRVVKTDINHCDSALYDFSFYYIYSLFVLTWGALGFSCIGIIFYFCCFLPIIYFTAASQ